MSGTPEILWAALRQYRHNTDNSPDLSNPKDGFVAAFDYDEVVRIIAAQQARIEELEPLLRDAIHRIGDEGFDAIWKKQARALLEGKP